MSWCETPKRNRTKMFAMLASVACASNECWLLNHLWTWKYNLTTRSLGDRIKSVSSVTFWAKITNNSHKTRIIKTCYRIEITELNIPHYCGGWISALKLLERNLYAAIFKLRLNEFTFTVLFLIDIYE